MSLKAHRIDSLPTSFYYIPNFISEDEEAQLVARINAPSARWTRLIHRRLQVHPTTLTKSNVLLAQPLPQWLTQPILTRFHDLGIFTESEGFGEDHDKDHKTPDDGGTSLGTPHQAPNHVLINEYPTGQGIMPHEDGDAYAPVVATVTLGGHCVLDLYEPRNTVHDADQVPETEPDAQLHGCRRPRHRILQEPCSLLVTRGPAYRSLLHGIADIDEDLDLDAENIVNWDLLGDAAPYSSGAKIRDLRLSLTFRDVIKVSNVGSKLFGRSRT